MKKKERRINNKNFNDFFKKIANKEGNIPIFAYLGKENEGFY